jgi:undecaprenyl diphosphate synthase
MSSILPGWLKRSALSDENVTLEQIRKMPLPRHIAIIMDGNGRWAKARSLRRAAGHRAGMETLKRIVESSIKIGIEYLTVYAFSTENWRRPADEVQALMGLLVEYVEKELNMLNQNGVKVTAIGRIEQLPTGARLQIIKAAEQTAKNNKLKLQIAINYGGRLELVDAMQEIAKAIDNKSISVKDIDENMIANYLYTKGIPDPDLIIRPSGEMRISNFLLWQQAYAEFWVTDILWPDFQENHYLKAIHDYQRRKRRFGGL